MTTAWVLGVSAAGTEVVGTGTDGIGISGEFAVELDSGTGVVMAGTSGALEVSGVEAGGGISGTVELGSGRAVVMTGIPGTVEVSGVEAGGGTHCVQTVDVLVIRTVEMVDVVSREVEPSLVTVFVT